MYVCTYVHDIEAKYCGVWYVALPSADWWLIVPVVGSSGTVTAPGGRIPDQLVAIVTVEIHRTPNVVSVVNLSFDASVARVGWGDQG